MAEYQITLNLDGVVRDLHVSLQRALDLARFGLHAARTAPDQDPSPGGGPVLPGVAIQLTIGQPMDDETAREEFVRWVVENGLRDAAEALGPLLEEARKVLRATATGPNPDPEYFNTKVTDEEERFDKRNLPDKLALLREVGGPDFMPTLTPHVTSLNAVRNCLVHGRGRVRQRDANTPDGLLVEYVRIRAIIDRPEGRTTIEALPDGTLMPSQFKAGDQIGIHHGPVSRLYCVGERLSIAAQDFADFCYTFLQFGNELRDELKAYVRDRGIPERKAAS